MIGKRRLERTAPLETPGVQRLPTPMLPVGRICAVVFGPLVEQIEDRKPIPVN